jgi:predicted  nucleic acid-binding Zn-ribbon protein
MRDRIDQLESANVVPGVLFDMDGADSSELKKQVDKLMRKTKSKESELKQAKSDLVATKNKLSKDELKHVKMEAQIREAATNLTEA